MKAGRKTSEFWMMLLAQLTGIAVLLGWIDIEAQSAIADAIAKGAAFIGQIAVVIRYIKTRGEVKVANGNGG